MANEQRLHRVGDQIQRELSELIRLELKDPRVHMVTIIGVDVSPDLEHARVRVSTLDTAHRDETMAGLRRAAGFLRAHLGRRLRTHATPELRFEYDDSIEQGVRLTQLIDQAVSTAKPDDER
jgi:ribosome-binding factor A